MSEGQTPEVNASRMDAVELLARANIEAMTEVRGLREDIAVVDAKRGRDLNLAKIALGLVLLLVIGIGTVAVTNRPILNLIKSTVTPEGPIYKENQARTALLLQALVAENDCRNRRTAAGLAPPPTTIVIRNGQAAALPKAPCGDLPDSPPGFQSPPKTDEPTAPPAREGSNWVPWFALGIAVTGGIAAMFLYRNRERKDDMR